MNSCSSRDQSLIRKWLVTVFLFSITNIERYCLWFHMFLTVNLYTASTCCQWTMNIIYILKQWSMGAFTLKSRLFFIQVPLSLFLSLAAVSAFSPQWSDQKSQLIRNVPGKRWTKTKRLITLFWDLVPIGPKSDCSCFLFLFFLGF